MKRIKYRTEPRKPKTVWYVGEMLGDEEVDGKQFETKKEAIKWIRKELKYLPDYTFELFKIQANFIEAWVE